MKMKYGALAALLLAGGLNQMAMAADSNANISFTGTLTSSSCSVLVNGESETSVDLGSNTLLEGSSQSTPAKSFAIDVSGCPASSKNAVLTLAGQAASQSSFYAVNIGGKAQNVVGLMIQDANGNGSIEPNKPIKYALTNSAAKINWTAALAAITDNPVPEGAVNTTLALNVQYE